MNIILSQNRLSQHYIESSKLKQNNLHHKLTRIGYQITYRIECIYTICRHVFKPLLDCLLEQLSYMSLHNCDHLEGVILRFSSYCVTSNFECYHNALTALISNIKLPSHFVKVKQRVFCWSHKTTIDFHSNHGKTKTSKSSTIPNQPDQIF